jgi:hypothetical protein
MDDESSENPNQQTAYHPKSSLFKKAGFSFGRCYRKLSGGGNGTLFCK